MKVIDFRSDTVTKPTKEMREAMYSSCVGDDVYEDDPTVLRLEQLAKDILGKEAALFVPTGTFSNQLSIMTHTNRGDEIIVEENAHIKKYEVGAVGGLSGVNIHAIRSKRGKMDLSEISRAIRGNDIHYPETKLICIENAHDGIALDLEYMKEVYKIAKDNNIKVHLDGARLFNAAVALNVEARELAKYSDSISICLSKGLSAPIGSLLVGEAKFIKKARKYRKMLGGGMRQVGVIAAPGIIALEKMTKRLSDDHDNAKFLANELDKFEFINVDKDRLDINMVFFDMNHIRKEELQKILFDENIIIGGYRPGGFRFACHNDIDKKDIEKLIRIIKSL
ncbi:low-specificity L-threonine aldolase [Mycoplasmatota bacterium]|nr:low-specificity L-threonine aldolase [Mycoplasmatota bacterium]